MARGGARALPDLEVELLPPSAGAGLVTDGHAGRVDEHEFGTGAWVDTVHETVAAAAAKVATRLAVLRSLQHRLAHQYLAVPPVRSRSLVQHHVWLPLPAILDVFDAAASGCPAPAPMGGLRLQTPLDYHAERRAFEAPCTMRLRWSYPELKLWLTVEPWRQNRSVISLRLRSSRRWRYPRRYYAAAHRGIDALVGTASSLRIDRSPLGSACGLADTPQS